MEVAIKVRLDAQGRVLQPFLLKDKIMIKHANCGGDVVRWIHETGWKSYALSWDEDLGMWWFEDDGPEGDCDSDPDGYECVKCGRKWESFEPDDDMDDEETITEFFARLGWVEEPVSSASKPA